MIKKLYYSSPSKTLGQDPPLDDDLLGTSPIDEIRNPSLLA